VPNEAVYLALIVAVLGPMAQQWRASRSRRKEKEQDWAREDLVAKRAADAAKAVADAATALLASNASQAKTLRSIEKVSKNTETLVNQNLTDANVKALLASEVAVSALDGLIAVQRRVGNSVDPERLTQVAELKATVAGLKDNLTGRAAAQAIVDKRLEIDEAATANTGR
jgi:hypothetical protein